MNKGYMFVPKGGMCRTCAFKNMKCSHLNFKKMRVIGVDDFAKLNIVKCDKFSRSSK